jgi:hypothetical protein
MLRCADDPTGRAGLRIVLLFIAVSTAATATVGTSAADLSSSVTLEVVGGPHAGKHSLKSNNGCIYAESSSPRNIEANLGMVSKDPQALTMVRSSVHNISRSEAHDASEFQFMLAFGTVGDKNHGTEYAVGDFTRNNRGKSGSGTMSMKDLGKDVQVNFDVQPEAGVQVRGVITCDPVRL